MSEEVIKVETKPEVKPTNTVKVTGSEAFVKVMKRILSEVLSPELPIRPDPRREYPETVVECLDEEMKYKKGTVEAIKTYRKSSPWKGTQKDMQDKLRALNADLSKVYGIEEPKLVFVDQFPTGPCCFPGSKPAVIMLQPTGDGRYSVTVFLHEFAHALGHDEKGACKWSLNLFKRFWPNSFGKLEHKGHMLYRRQEENPTEEIVKPEAK